MKTTRALQIVTAIAVLCFTACSQTLLWEHFSANSTTQTDSLYGGSLAVLTDVDFDGVNDIVVGSSGSPNGTLSTAGYVGVLSGATGNIVWEYHGISNFMLLGFAGLAGDVNGDGAGDLWVSYYPSGGGALTVVLSGTDGSFLPNPPLSANPVFVAVGDLNGDTVGDYVVAQVMLTAYAGPIPTSVLWSVPNTVSGGPAFTQVVPIGDVNGDGINDVLTGASGGCSMITTIGPGAAYIVSGANGAFLRQWNGTATCDYFGMRVTAPGDLDGDGLGDAVVMSGGSSTVHVFSSATGLSLGTLAGTTVGDAGLCSLGDVDGDGFGDFAHQFTNFSPYYIGVRVESGQTLTTLYTFDVMPYTYLGQSCVAPGDLNGDGFPDLVVGLTSTQPTGSVRAYSLAPAGVTPNGSGGCPLASGLVPRIGVTGALVPGQNVTVSLSRVSPLRPAYLVLGASNTSWGATPLPFDLTPLGLAGCQLYASIDQLLPFVTTQIRPGEGAASISAVVPPLTGLTLYAQWGVENPVGSPQIGALSGSLALTIQ